LVHRRGGTRVRLHRSGDRPVAAEGAFLLSSSVVIVSHRTGEYLRSCVESVVDQYDEVLVIDNGSPDGKASEVARASGAKSLRLRRNTGWACAANVGIHETSGEVVGFLHDDTVAAEQWVATASRLLDDPTIGAVAPRVVRRGRFLQVSLRDEPTFADGNSRPLGRQINEAKLGGQDVLPLLTGPGIYEVERAHNGTPTRWTSGVAAFFIPLGNTDTPIELEINGQSVRPSRVVDLLSSAGTYLQFDGRAGDIGANSPDEVTLEAAEERFGLSATALVTTRSALQRVGKFCPRYFSSYEDVDWCWRARLMGLRMFFDPAITVRRDVPPAAEETARRRAHLLERNRILTLVRNAPFDLAVNQVWQKRKADHDDGVARLLPRLLPRALAERELLSRRWVVRPRDVFERWAGLDVPSAG
jgi:GT2 family glycosyltransferase